MLDVLLFPNNVRLSNGMHLFTKHFSLDYLICVWCCFFTECPLSIDTTWFFFLLLLLFFTHEDRVDVSKWVGMTQNIPHRAKQLRCWGKVCPQPLPADLRGAEKWPRQGTKGTFSEQQQHSFRGSKWTEGVPAGLWTSAMEHAMMPRGQWGKQSQALARAPDFKDNLKKLD